MEENLLINILNCECIEDKLSNNENNSKNTITNNFESEEKNSFHSTLKNGHWSREEHQRFIEAIFLHGNDWKLVQSYIESRSSTQARSHAQKFFIRMKKKLKIENKTSKNISKDILLNFFKECLPNREIKEENRDKLMKIISNFTESPTKKTYKKRQENDLTVSSIISKSMRNKKKLYFEINKVY